MIDLVPLHGGQMGQIAERFGIPVAELIDFSANINPDGPPPAVLATLHAGLEDLSILTDYPDLEEAGLKQAVARYAGVRLQNIAVANGFIPLLESALRTLKVKRCRLPVPAFVEYRRSLARAGIEIEPFALSPASNFRYDIDALMQGDPDAILLANPQNPSGVLTDREILLQLVSKCAERKIAVLLDEAFIDYTPLESLVADVECWSNLIVFRSVTKLHGVPGLRVAYAAANQATARILQENLPPWPITTLASRAVAAALGDQAFEELTRRRNEDRGRTLKAGLEALGLHTYPAAANFLLLRLPEGASVVRFWNDMIVKHHIVVRDCSNYEALPPGHVRVAIHKEEENAKLVRAMAQTLASC